MRPLAERPILELDALWSWVGTTGEQVWMWVALERQTRRIVGLAFGDRTTETWRTLWESLPPDDRNRAIGESDFWAPDAKVRPAKRQRPGGKETGEPAHIERFHNTVRHVAPIWCREPCRSVKTNIGMSCASGSSSITTIVNWSAPAVLHQFR